MTLPTWAVALIAWVAGMLAWPLAALIGMYIRAGMHDDETKGR